MPRRTPALVGLLVLHTTWLSLNPCGAQEEPVAPERFAHLAYRCVGPTRGGRVTAITGVIQQPGTYYMGASGGGVWKTTDDGEHWANVSDGFFETASIGAIAVAPSDPNVVWVGTGSDGLRSNVITGRGVYKSMDAGTTWAFVGLRDVGQIGAVEVHPANPDVCFVAAIGMAFGPTSERGVYRTGDGGTTWEKVLFVSPTCGAVDLEVNPANPDELYACTWRAERKPWTIISGGLLGGIHRSRDGGTTWTKLAGGLPNGLFGKSDLAVCKSAPDTVYALIEAERGAGLYRSNDRGDTWAFVSDQRGLLDRPFYYCNVDVDPNDVDHVFVAATGMHESKDGGKTWNRMRTPHGDNHGIWIHPDDSKRMIQCNDGGANVSQDGGRTWSTQRNQPTAELYQVAVDDRHPYWLYAGQQDNSTIRVPSAPVRGDQGGPNGPWESVGGCETGPAIPKPGDPDTVYAACKGRFGVWDARTGQERQYYVGALNMYGHDPQDLPYRFQRVSPIHVSPHDPNVVYHGSQYVHRTRDEGRTWETISPDLTAFTPETQGVSGTPITRDVTGEEFYSTLYVIRESPLVQGLIWTGANDGPIHVTHDGGQVWLNVTPPDLPTGGRVQCIEPSPHDAAKAYVAVYRYLLGDWQPYIYRTVDAGVTWTRLTSGDNGIPIDTPTRVVREDPDREGLLYAGTEFGMFVSFDDGGHWQSFQQNLPVTPVTDIVVHEKDLVLSTMGRSFWILDDVSCLHQLDPETRELDLTLFTPRAAIRERAPRSARRTGGDASAVDVPTYAPSGASIDYSVPEGLTGQLTLTVADDGGNVVATFRSGERARESVRERTTRESSEGEEDPAERGGMEGPGSGEIVQGRSSRSQRSRAPELSAEAGSHRFHWDLRAGRSVVPPGTYTVRLQAGEVVREAPLIVRLDPNLVERGITEDDVREQHAFLERVDALQARADDAAKQVDSWLEHLRIARIDHGPMTSIEQAEMALLALRDRLTTKREGAYQQPMLTSQIRYLRSNLARADQAPGNHAYERLDAHESELETIERALKRVVEPSLDPTRLTVERLFHGIEFLELQRPTYRWTPDGSAFAAVERTSGDEVQIAAYDVKSGRRTVRSELDLEHPWSLAWIEANGERLRYFLHSGEDRYVLSAGNLARTGKAWDVEITSSSVLPYPFPDEDHLTSPDGTHAIVARSTFFVPPVVQLVTTKDERVLRTLQANDLLRAKHEALAETPIERTSVDFADTSAASAFLLFPRGFDETKRYATVFVQGALNDGDFLADRWSRDHAFYRLLAHEGYVVVGIASHALPVEGRSRAFDRIVERLQETHPYLDRERAAWVDLHTGSLSIAEREPQRFAVAAFDLGRARPATTVDAPPTELVERDRPKLLVLLDDRLVVSPERAWLEGWQTTENLREWTFPKLAPCTRWRRSRETITRFLLETMPPARR